jgi:hypothetical protein
MKNKFAWLAALPEVDFFEVFEPDIQPVDAADTSPGYVCGVRFRPTERYKQQVRILYREDKAAGRGNGMKKTVIVHAVFYDDQEKPIFKSKPYFVRLKRKAH